MLTISSLSKSFGGRTLFSEASLQVNAGNRIGLVGPNGAGKSTLFSLILGDDEPDGGSVILDRHAILGYLPQESAPAGSETVLQLATAVSPEVAEVQKIMAHHEANETTDHEDFQEAAARFDEMQGYSLEPKAKKILRGLAFRQSDFDRPARELSGGWIMRAHLARLLVMEPDLLMLDEPTNHLDLESLGWFQSYLKSYPGAILVISHDREFLNAIVDGIVEISREELHHYKGSYDSFLVQRESRYEQWVSSYENQQKEIQQLQRFIDRFRAKASKASQAQSKMRQLERMEKIPAPPRRDGPALNFRFPQPKRGGQKVIALKDIHMSYGENVVYEGVDFEAERDQRTVLVGPNGAGKSTLLKILGDVVPFQKGERTLGHNISVGYYAQHRTEMLNESKTVLQTALDSPRSVGEQEIRSLLGCFLFRGDDVFKNVGVLSGGEKSRLALVQFLLDPPNLLLMDEPTTHLDIPSIDALINALKQYEGTLIFISHDVYFIRAISDSVLHINAGELTRYAGDYQYFLDKSEATSERAALTLGNYQPPEEKVAAGSNAGKTHVVRKTKEQKRKEAEARQARAKARKAAEAEVSRIEGRIGTLEARQTEIGKVMEDAEAYKKNPGGVVAMNRELLEIADELVALTAKWEKQAGLLEANR